MDRSQAREDFNKRYGIPQKPSMPSKTPVETKPQILSSKRTVSEKLEPMNHHIDYQADQRHPVPKKSSNNISLKQESPVDQFLIISRLCFIAILIGYLPLQVSHLACQQLTKLTKKNYLKVIYQYTQLAYVYAVPITCILLSNIIYDYAYYIDAILILAMNINFFKKTMLLAHLVIISSLVLKIYFPLIYILVLIIFAVILHLNTVKMIMEKMIMPDQSEVMLNAYLNMDTVQRIGVLSNLIGIHHDQMSIVDQFLIFQFDFVLTLRHLKIFSVPWLSMITVALSSIPNKFEGVTYSESIQRMTPTLLVAQFTSDEVDLRREAIRKLRSCVEQ